MAFKNIFTGRELSQEMQGSLIQFHRLVEHRLPEKVEVLLEKLIIESFEKEQYQNKGTGKWRDRKKFEPGRKILIGKGSGKLRRSIEVERDGMEVKASSDVPYAAVHNEGLRSGRGSGFQMPQRQFMPKPGEGNEEMDQAVEKWMDGEMDKIFN